MKEKVLKNGFWLYFLQFFNAILPLVTLPYITRILGPEGYGSVAISLNFIGYIQAIIEYGFGMSTTRKLVLLDKNNRNEINKLFTAVIFARLILYVICSFIVIIYVFISSDRLNSRCVTILFIGLLGFCFQQNWLFQGMQEMRNIALVNIISRSISVFMTFVFVKKVDDIFLYCLLYNATPIICGTLGVIIANKRFGVSFCHIVFDDVIMQLKEGWNVFCTQLSAKVFGAIGITFLGIMASNFYVGVFSAIQKIPSIFFLCWNPISQVLYPYSSKIVSEDFKSGMKYIFNLRKIIMIFLMLLILIVGIFAKPIVSMLFGSEYSNYYYILYPLIGWAIISINNNFLGIQILLGGGYDKEYSKCFHISVFCTVVLNYTLILRYGIIGAAFAPMISESILMCLLNLEIKKIECKR